MQEPVAEVGAAHNYKHTNGIGVYYFIRDLLEEGNDLIEEGKDAWFVNDKGRFAINWVRSPGRYADYKSRNKNIDKRKASNNLRSALLNFYEKEGAKEYKESQKKNEKGEIIERQFQIPPRIFKALFGPGMLLTDDDSEQEIGNIASEVCKSSQETSNSSDTGFDEAMDISSDGSLEFQCQTPLSFNLLPPLTAVDITSSLSLHTDFFNISDPDDGFVNGGILTDGSLPDNTKSDEIDLDPPDEFPTPFEILGISEKDLREEICFKHPDSYNDQAEVVESIFPLAGSVEGGLSFDIILKEELPEEDTSAIYVADFEGLCVVDLAKLDHSTLAGITPPALVPGPVKVTVKTPAGQLPGSTSFLYVDHKTQEVLEQLVKDPALQSLYSRLCDRELSIFGSDSSTALNLGSFAVQGQAVPENETDLESGQYEDEDKESDYFADAETSSCGSFELEAGWSDSEDGEEHYLKDGTPKGKLSEKSNSSLEEGASLEIPEAVFLPEAGMQLSNAVIEKDDEDENSEETSTANSKPSMNSSNGSGLVGWLGKWRRSDATTSRHQRACSSFELDVGWSDLEDEEGPCSKDGGPKKELSKRSSSSLEEGSSFEIPVVFLPEVGMLLDNDVEKEDDDDDNYEGLSMVNPYPGLAHKRLSALQIVDATTSRQQGASVDEMQEKQSFTDSDDDDDSQDSPYFRVQNGTGSYGQEWWGRTMTVGDVLRVLRLLNPWRIVIPIPKRLEETEKKQQRRRFQEQRLSLQQENQVLKREMKMLNTTGGMEINTFIERIIMENEKLWTEIKTVLNGETEASLKEMNDRQIKEVLRLLNPWRIVIPIPKRLEETEKKQQRRRFQEQRISLQQENQVLKREMKMLNTTGGMEIKTFIERIIMENEKLCTEIKTLLKDETEGSLQDINDKQTKEVTALLEEIDVHQDGIEELKLSGDERKASQDEMEGSLKEMNDKQKQTIDSSEEEEEHAENLEELPQLY